MGSGLQPSVPQKGNCLSQREVKRVLGEEKDPGLSQKSESQNPENEVTGGQNLQIKGNLGWCFLLVSIISLMCRVEEQLLFRKMPLKMLFLYKTKEKSYRFRGKCISNFCFIRSQAFRFLR